MPNYSYKAYQKAVEDVILENADLIDRMRDREVSRFAIAQTLYSLLPYSFTEYQKNIGKTAMKEPDEDINVYFSEGKFVERKLTVQLKPIQELLEKAIDEEKEIFQIMVSVASRRISKIMKQKYIKWASRPMIEYMARALARYCRSK